MSLVENIVKQISTQGLSGITTPFGFDMNDNTFANILDKQMDSWNVSSTSNFVGNFGVPAGLVIEPLDGVDFAGKVQDQMDILGEDTLSKEEYINQPIEIKEIDNGDYFSNLLKTNSNENSSFMNFARKNATNAYDIFSKGFVSDMKDFVEDIASTL